MFILEPTYRYITGAMTVPATVKAVMAKNTGFFAMNLRGISINIKKMTSVKKAVLDLYQDIIL